MNVIIEDGRKPYAGLQWLDHDSMYLVIVNVSDFAEIQGEYDLVLRNLFTHVATYSIAVT